MYHCIYSQEALLETKRVYESVTKNLHKNSSDQIAETFGLLDGFTLESIQYDAQYPDNHNSYQLYYRGIKVDKAVLHQNVVKDASIYTGLLYQFTLESLVPKLLALEAFDIAKNQLDLEFVDSKWMEYESADLVIYVDEHESRVSLAYAYQVYHEESLYHALIYVDAHSGVLLAEESHICTFHPITTFGRSLHNGNVFISTNQDTNGYILGGSGMVAETYDMNGSVHYGDASIVRGNRVFSQLNGAVQAHYGAERTYDYFKYRHDRNSYDNNGAILKSYINYGQNYTNAFWDGRRMSYGAGDDRFYGAVVALDISGHEFSHGVIDHSAELVYSRESGALNESFADIFGEMVEYFATGENDWLLGSEVGLVSGMSYRSMRSPKDNGDPDTYKGDNWVDASCDRPMRSNDQCGVHSNSGVQNKWFFILSIGESGVNDLGDAYDVIGINRNAAAAIAYRNLTHYLHPRANYMDARNGSIQAAIDLFGKGSIQEISTTNAWYAVGVGQAYQKDIQTSAIISFEPNVDSISSNSISISWEQGIGGDSVSYEIYVDDYLFAITSDNNYSLSKLNSSTSYHIYVAIINSDNERIALSKEIKVTTDKLPPSQIQLLLDSVTHESATISWINPNYGSFTYSYYLNNEWIGSTKSTTIELSDLSSESEHTFWLEAIDWYGQVIYSDTITFLTLPYDLPISELAGFYFESGWDSWTPTDDDSEWYQGERAAEGGGAIRLKGEGGMVSPLIDLSNSEDALLDFDFFAWSMELGDAFEVSISYDSIHWQVISILESYIDFDNYHFNHVSIPLDLDQDQIYIRLKSNANMSSDHIYIDRVIIKGYGDKQSFFTQKEPIKRDNLDFILYPNPVVNMIQVKLHTGANRLELYKLNGQLVKQWDITDGSEMSISVNDLHGGIYYLRSIHESGSTGWQKFIKQ